MADLELESTTTDLGSRASTDSGNELLEESSEFMHHTDHSAEMKRRRKQGGEITTSVPTKSPDFVEVDSLDRSIAADDQDYDHHLAGRSIFDKSFVPPLGMTRSSMSANTRKQQERGDIEIWWLNSPTWRRTAPIMCIVMLFMTLCHVGVAIYYFTAEDKSADDFDVCKTQGCQDIANWILVGLDRSQDPCDDFYKFACNNYANPAESVENVPNRTDFSFVKLQFNDQSVLGDILKPGRDPLNVVIPFVKSCLDTRRRNSEDLKGLVVIIGETVPNLFLDPIGFNRALGSKRVSDSIGYTGFFSYQLLQYPNVSFLPPRPWLLSYREALSTESGYTKFVDNLNKTYTILWKALLESEQDDPLLDPLLAANYTARTVKMLTTLNFTHLPIPTDPTVRAKTRLLLQTLLGEEWVLETSVVRSKIFTEADVGLIINGYDDNFANEEIGPSLVSFWVFCTLEYYGNEISSGPFNQLELTNVFPHLAADELQESSLERFCFRGLAEYLNGLTFNLFADSLDTELLEEKMGEEYLKIRRALRDIYFIEHLNDGLRPLDGYILRNFINPRSEITLNFPFPIDAETLQFFEEFESYHLSFRPGPDYLRNIFDATVNQQTGELRSWVENSRNHRIFQNFQLERIQSEIDDSVVYGNNVYPPIVLFDNPLFLNDMRVFDHAGAIFFLARGMLELWKHNIEDFGAIAHLQPPGSYEISRNLLNIYENYCMFKNKKVVREVFFNSDVSKDALAFIIAEQMYRKPNQYLSLRHKENGTIAVGVDYLYSRNNSIDYVRVFTSEEEVMYQYLDKANYITVDQDRFKFQYKRAPNGLEDFTDSQLYFLAAIRHQCYTRSAAELQDSIAFATGINQLLQQLDEFAEAWNCPVGSPMNPPNKCI